MALQKIGRGMLNTGVSDSSDATAITIDSSENVTLTGSLTSGTSVTAPSGFLGGSNGGIRIHAGGTKFFNITAANAARDNIMDIGASDARFKDLYLGGGAYLGGTASTNKLSTYAEGDATLAIATSDTQYTTSGQSDSSRYIRIGSIVIIWASISITSPTGGSGALRVTGLPYTNASGGPAAITSMVKMGRIANAATQNPYGELPNGSDVITFYYNRDGNTQTTFAASNLNGQVTPYIEFVLVYET